MKKLIFTQILIIVSTFTAIAQTADERDLLTFIGDYDQAYMKNDIAFVERNLHEDYVFVLDGERKNRAELLAEIRAEIAKPMTVVRDLRSKNDGLRVVGETAVATGLIDWKETPKDNPRGESNSGQERYTLVWERRGGRWLLLSEHISSIRRDRKTMEAEVTKASQEYTEMIRRRAAAAIERVLTEEYVLTNETGQMRNKAQELERVKNSPYKLESLTMSEQKVRVYNGNMAVETGKINYKSADKDGKSLAGIERYTTVWIRRDGRWQIVSDHLSDVKE
jgi:ketosteroid isomerase-like protein